MGDRLAIARRSMIPSAKVGMWREQLHTRAPVCPGLRSNLPIGSYLHKTATRVGGCFAIFYDGGWRRTRTADLRIMRPLL